jgi:hypothetical protein
MQNGPLQLPPPLPIRETVHTQPPTPQAAFKRDRNINSDQFYSEKIRILKPNANHQDSQLHSVEAVITVTFFWNGAPYGRFGETYCVHLQRHEGLGTQQCKWGYNML